MAEHQHTKRLRFQRQEEGRRHPWVTARRAGLLETVLATCWLKAVWANTSC